MTVDREELLMDPDLRTGPDVQGTRRSVDKKRDGAVFIWLNE